MSIRKNIASILTAGLLCGLATAQPTGNQLLDNTIAKYGADRIIYNPNAKQTILHLSQIHASPLAEDRKKQGDEVVRSQSRIYDEICHLKENGVREIYNEGISFQEERMYKFTPRAIDIQSYRIRERSEHIAMGFQYVCQMRAVIEKVEQSTDKDTDNKTLYKALISAINDVMIYPPFEPENEWEENQCALGKKHYDTQVSSCKNKIVNDINDYIKREAKAKDVISLLSASVASTEKKYMNEFMFPGGAVYAEIKHGLTIMGAEDKPLFYEISEDIAAKAEKLKQYRHEVSKQIPILIPVNGPRVERPMVLEKLIKMENAFMKDFKEYGEMREDKFLEIIEGVEGIIPVVYGAAHDWSNNIDTNKTNYIRLRSAE